MVILKGQKEHTRSQKRFWEAADMEENSMSLGDWSRGRGRKQAEENRGVPLCVEGHQTESLFEPGSLRNPSHFSNPSRRSRQDTSHLVTEISSSKQVYAVSDALESSSRTYLAGSKVLNVREERTVD